MEAMNLSIEAAGAFWKNQHRISISDESLQFWQTFFIAFRSGIIIGHLYNETIKGRIVHPIVSKHYYFGMQLQCKREINVRLMVGNDERRLIESFFTFIDQGL